MQAATWAPAGRGVPASERASDCAPAGADTADPAAWEALSRPVPGPGGRRELVLAISGMHCPGCSLLVEQALAACAGVADVQVSGASRTARVTWGPGGLQPSAWLASLHRGGYGAVPVADPAESALRRREQRLLLWRWLVAGFCMMQVMMYAVPAYVAPPGEITPDIAALLRWASWILTLPVLLFSCAPFFRSALRDLRHRRVGMDVPVALGIAVAFGASTASTFDPAGPLGAEVWFDSVAMFVFFLLSGRLLEQRLRERTTGALEALVRTLPDAADRLAADGRVERVSTRTLSVGDRIRVRPGECFPCDGVIEAGATRVDEALLTGESEPLRRTHGDAVIGGSHNLSGVVEVRVTAVGGDTRHAGIVGLMERAAFDKPRAVAFAERVAGPFLLAVLCASATALAWWWPVDPGRAVGTAVAILIVTCPCALSLATPAATLAAAGALARRGVLVRNLAALEAAGLVDTVVFDKTGTLTQDRLALAEVVTRAGLDRDQVLRQAAALAQGSLHPLSRALAAFATGAASAPLSLVEVPGKASRGRWRHCRERPLACDSARPCSARPLRPWLPRGRRCTCPTRAAGRRASCSRSPSGPMPRRRWPRCAAVDSRWRCCPATVSTPSAPWHGNWASPAPKAASARKTSSRACRPGKHKDVGWRWSATG
jgi:Cu2+-exporting ATPase